MGNNKNYIFDYNCYFFWALLILEHGIPPTVLITLPKLYILKVGNDLTAAYWHPTRILSNASGW